MPTTVTTTVGATARDHSTAQAWEAATGNDLVAADEIQQGEAYDDANFGGATFTIDGATVDATRYRRLFAASGQEFDPSDGTGCFYSSTTHAAARMWNVRDPFTRIERWGLETLKTGANTSHVLELHSTGGNSKVIACYLKSVTTTITTGSVCLLSNSGGNEILSCITVGDGGVSNQGATSGFKDNSNANDYYNCVAYKIDNGTTAISSEGFNVQAAGSNVKNCASVDSEGSDFNFGGSTTTSNNASSDTTGDVQSVVGTTIWTDPANDDFTPVSGEALINAGTDSPGSSDASMDPDQDHVSTFEIGAFNFTAVGGARRRLMIVS